MKTSPPKQKNGVISFGLGLVIKGIEWLLVCMVLPLIITMTLLVFKGRVTGLIYFQGLFHDELFWLKTIITQTRDGQGLLEWILQSIKFLQTATTSFTTLNNMPATLHYALFKKLAIFICPLLVAYGSALLLTLQLTLLRIATVLLFTPLFLILGSIGVIDGLIQRHLRRINGGRESALVYHHTRNAVLPILFISTGLYVILPFRLPPLLFLLTGAMAFAICLFFTTKTFKKYL